MSELTLIKINMFMVNVSNIGDSYAPGSISINFIDFCMKTMIITRGSDLI